MTAEEYEKISAPFRSRKERVRWIVATDKCLTGVVFAAYPLLLLYLLAAEREHLGICFFVPLISFVLVSLFRAVYSAKRPYEVLEIKPLVIKKTKGKSFPSRHVFSVFIIGMAFSYINIGIAVFIGILGILMGYVRVVLGVHFPKDVIAGALTGIVCGMAGYLVMR